MNDQTPRKRSKFTSVSVQEVHSNVDQEVIEITTDKLALILTQYVNLLSSNKEWQAPLGVFITILVVFCTSSFKDFLTVNASVWNALFILLGIGSFLWLLKALLQIKKGMSVDDLMDKIKNKT